MRLGNVSAKAIMIDGFLVVVDALRALARHQCARDLIEEFLCVEVLPLKANQRWFAINDDALYKDCGIKGLEIDVKKACLKVMGKGDTSMAGIKAVYNEVAMATEDHVGSPRT